MDTKSDYSFRSFRMNSWDKVRELARQLDWWAFRGQEKESWHLDTKLERVIGRYPNRPIPRRIAEGRVLGNFQRNVHHYVTDLSSNTPNLDALAWVQHYGGPTRLLDFTYSFYVAAFFAVESAGEEPSAIWAINYENLGNVVKQKIGLEIAGRLHPLDCVRYVESEIGKSLKEPNQKCLVVPVEPSRQNERTMIQQGLFLFPVDIDISFEDNLAETFQLPRDIFAKFQVEDEPNIINNHESILKILLPPHIRRDALADLRRMNITATTLFPGLDGFARSLQYYCS